MRTVLGFAATAWIGAIASPAAAEHPYDYDAPAFCEKVGEISGGSAWMQKQCLYQELEALDMIDAMPDLGPTIEQFCDQVARPTVYDPGSYWVYLRCAQQEIEAGKWP
jgi:hypothetical protein